MMYRRGKGRQWNTPAGREGIKTNIAANARGLPDVDRVALAQQFKRMAVTRPEAAATTIMKGVEKNAPRVLIGPDARIFDFIPRAFGAGYEDVLAALVRFGSNRRGRLTGRMFASSINR